MYQYIKGMVAEIGEDYIVIDNNDIGYLIHTSKNSIMSLGQDNIETKIYTYLHVREDVMSLYGFLSKEELSVFKLLLLVSGIGPKVALGMLSVLSPANIKMAIVNNDIDMLSRAPGIGKKTGKRLVLELKDKIDDNLFEENNPLDVTIGNDVDEAIDALLSLGYTRGEINNVVSKIDKDSLSTENIIKIALKKLSQN